MTEITDPELRARGSHWHLPPGHTALVIWSGNSVYWEDAQFLADDAAKLRGYMRMFDSPWWQCATKDGCSERVATQASTSPCRKRASQWIRSER